MSTNMGSQREQWANRTRKALRLASHVLHRIIPVEYGGTGCGSLAELKAALMSEDGDNVSVKGDLTIESLAHPSGVRAIGVDENGKIVVL